MAYRTDEVQGTPEEISEISAFLAAFVSDGELERQRPIDTRTETWEKRLAGWWTENPYCCPKMPKGLVLRDEARQPVGLFGFIPHDYDYRGERVPTLISTTFYVRAANRDAALGLFLRAHRRRDSFQFIDGDPNPGTEALLLKCGYVRGEQPTILIYPIRRLRPSPKSLLARAFSLALPKDCGLPPGGSVVTRAEAVGEVPTTPCHLLRKHCNRDTLVWYQNSGTQAKHFVGWVDGNGVLRCYLLGILWRKLGQDAFVIIKYAAFDEAFEAILERLVLHAARHPEEAGLPRSADLLIWPVIEERSCASPFHIPQDLKVYYRLPTELRDAPRLARAFDGDKIFY